MSFWHLRPSALGASYETIDVGRLHQHYRRDNGQVHGPLVLPPKGQLLRIGQWNIDHLSYAVGRYVNTEEEAAEAMTKLLIDTGADILVLNEYGVDGHRSSSQRFPFISHLTANLEAAGYRIHVASSDYPTAVATKIEEATVYRHRLSYSRSAVGIRVQDAHGRFVRIYGTHLEVSDGRQGKARLEGMKNLLEQIKM